jgi:hypothetical protein
VIEPGKQAIACLIDGRLDETIELCQTGMRRGDEAGRPIMGRLLPLWAKLAAGRYMGQPDRSLEMVREFIALVGAAPEVLTQLTLAECVSLLGRMEEAKDIVSPLTDSGFDDWQIAELVLRLQLALLWRERDAAAELADRLQPVAHLVIVNGFTGSVARLIGLRWVVDGDVVRARAAFELAVRACEQIRFRPELAVARLDLAELILAH